MSVSYIPNWIKLCLWGQAAGRCQYTGCNCPLYRDDVTQAEFNSAYIAHIIADKPDGPRGDPVLSGQLRQDLSNLMLLCDVHHRLVDKIDVAGHPAPVLQEMKRTHEERIELLTGIAEEKQSHVLLYGARIGEHDAPLTMAKAQGAMVPERFPASARPICLGMKHGTYADAEAQYWSIEREHLRRQIQAVVRPLLADEAIEHLSIFALAPIPLLIELGRQLSDIPAADVFQLHREPPDWVWHPQPTDFQFTVSESHVTDATTVALVLSLSATITPDRVHAVLGDDTAIWTVTHASPGNDFLKSREQLQAFRRTVRKVFDDIKAKHGDGTQLHVFPAIPVSAAIEFGRVWMPKADLSFDVYDQNRATGGFTHALTISQGH